MRNKSADRSPLSVTFATWREAVVHLRSRILVNGVPLAPDDFGELLASRAKKGSARAWTAWLRGMPDVRLSDDDARTALREMAGLFVKHWPTSIRASVKSRTAEDREHLVARIAALLAALPHHASPTRAAAPISGASLQALVNRYLADHRLRHRDLATQLSTRLRTDSKLCALVEEGDADAIEAWHVQRVASGTGLDLDRPTYYLLIRAFAVASHQDPGPFFALPFSSPHLPQEWGASLQIRLTGLAGSQTGGPLVDSFRDQASLLVARVVAERLSQRPDRYLDFEAKECPTLDETGDATFELVLRLKPRLEPPPSAVYGPVLLLLSECARQLRLAWNLHTVNLDRLRGGGPTCDACFVVHAGILSRERQAETPGSSTGIAFTQDAYFHARATDLRVVWEALHKDTAATGRAPHPPPSGPAAGEHSHRGVQAFQSHIYFGEVRRFTENVGAGGQRCVEIAEAKPRDAFLRIELATSLFQRRAFHDALRVAQSVCAIDVRHPTAWALMSVCYANLARTFHGDRQHDAPANLDSIARYYHRALRAARLALEADPTQEDAYDSCGCLHLLRALDCYRWYDQELLAQVGADSDTVRLLLIQAGFDWAAHPQPGDDIAGLLRRAAVSDLVEARRHFDCGLDVSATKSRSFFWRLIADALLGAVTGAALDVRKARLLPKIFLELGWISSLDDDDAVLSVLERKVEEYDASLLLELYLPDVQFAYAVAYWDFIEPTKETSRRVRNHLTRALALTGQDPAGFADNPALVVRCWGFLQTADAFKQTLQAALRQIDAWDATGAHAPLYPLYVGDSFSRAFPQLLQSLVSAAGAKAARARAAGGLSAG